MESIKHETEKRIILDMLLSQSKLHNIDALSVQPEYVRELKREYNRHERFMDSRVNDILKHADTEEAEYYNEFVKQLDSLCETFLQSMTISGE